MFGSARFTARLAIVSAFAAGIRIVEAVVVRGDQPTTKVSDEFGYLKSAELLAHGHGFINPYWWELDHSKVDSAIHPPFFSIVLAIPSRLGLESVLGYRIFNGFIGVALVFAIGLLARELAGETAGLVAAVIAALYPHLWISDTAIMPEALFCLLVVLGLLAAYRFRKHPTWLLAAATATAFSLAAMTRSEGVLLVAFVALPLALFAPGVDRTTRLKFAGVVCIVAGLIIGPWVVRNLIVFDKTTTMASGTGHVLAYGNCDATYSGKFLGYWNDTCALKNWPPGDESVVNEAAQRQGLHYVRTHLGRQPVVVSARVGRLFELFRPGQNVSFNAFFERRGVLPSRLALAAYYLLLAPALYGLYVMRRRGLMIWPIVVITGVVAFIAAITFGVTRYRAPFDALLPVLAAVGIMALVDRRIRPSGRAPDEVLVDHQQSRAGREVAAPVGQ